MKKLLTLVLALVLVFAIAAPAMAITDTTANPDTVTPVPVDFINLDLALFTAPPTSGAFGGFAVSQIAANKAYIVNEVLYYGVLLNFPELDEDAGEVANMDPKDYANTKLTLSSKEVALENPNKIFAVNDLGQLVPTGWTWANLAADVNVGGDLGSGYTYYAFGQGLVKKAGIVKAELKAAIAFPFDIFAGTTKLYNVAKQVTPGKGYVVTAYKADGTVAGTVGFNTTAKDKVSGISVDLGTEGWKFIAYNVTYNNGLKPVVAAKALLNLDGTVYADVSLGSTDTTGFYKAGAAGAFAVYEKVMAFFGFDAAKDGLLLDQHFTAKASRLYLKDEVAVQLYTGSIVIPSDVDVPKTGDAASIVGFVMIAVAMIAAGVVVSRKVRA